MTHSGLLAGHAARHVRAVAAAVETASVGAVFAATAPAGNGTSHGSSSPPPKKAPDRKSLSHPMSHIDIGVVSAIIGRC